LTNQVMWSVADFRRASMLRMKARRVNGQDAYAPYFSKRPA
jgi:hypothetical protein